MSIDAWFYLPYTHCNNHCNNHWIWWILIILLQQDHFFGLPGLPTVPTSVQTNMLMKKKMKKKNRMKMKVVKKLLLIMLIVVNCSQDLGDVKTWWLIVPNCSQDEDEMLYLMQTLIQKALLQYAKHCSMGWWMCFSCRILRNLALQIIAEIIRKLMLRIEYYFSVNNLVKDVHLRKNVAQLKSLSKKLSRCSNWVLDLRFID